MRIGGSSDRALCRGQTIGALGHPPKLLMEVTIAKYHHGQTMSCQRRCVDSMMSCANCEKRADELKCGPDEVNLSGVRSEAPGWSDGQVRSFCRQLVEMQYLYAVVNGNGRPCRLW